ncbi:phage tail protein [Niveispirillum sp. KHB5.9]|uniref:phage tail protein n=1 Tax=Niveispirillum sp. KHB5.9 TaxID=3400269 RepID=UPI003A8931CF
MSDFYVGEIRLFAGNYVPAGWQECDGTVLSINSYQALYSLLGTRYGGNGTTNFAVPDLRGRLPIGYGTNGGAGISSYTLGQSGGVTTVTLTEAQIPLHTHPEVATTNQATSTSPIGNILADPDDAYNLYTPYNTTNNTPSMAATVIQSTGGGQAHTNIMPSMVMRYIIALNGTYPMAT